LTDIESIIRAYLVAQAGILALTSTRVYASPYLPPGYQPSDGSALLLSLRGGGQDYSSRVLEASLYVRSYAATATAARTLDRAVYDAFNDVRSSTIKWARLETPGQLLQEPETGWVFVLSAYRVLVAN